MPEEKLRMDAYYYSFDATGCEPIDKILSAVACAGKGDHHTEYWNDSEDGEPSPIDRIQKAAGDAAEELERLKKWEYDITEGMLKSKEEIEIVLDEPRCGECNGVWPMDAEVCPHCGNGNAF